MLKNQPQVGVELLENKLRVLTPGSTKLLSSDRRFGRLGMVSSTVVLPRQDFSGLVLSPIASVLETPCVVLVSVILELLPLSLGPQRPTCQH